MEDATVAGGVYEVVSPEGSVVVNRVAPTPPVTDLSGKTVAQLWDYRFKGDEMFRILERELGAKFPGVRFVPYHLFGDTHQANDQDVVERIAGLLLEHGCEAAISGVGA